MRDAFAAFIERERILVVLEVVRRLRVQREAEHPIVIVRPRRVDCLPELVLRAVVVSRLTGKLASKCAEPGAVGARAIPEREHPTVEESHRQVASAPQRDLDRGTEAEACYRERIALFLHGVQSVAPPLEGGVEVTEATLGRSQTLEHAPRVAVASWPRRSQACSK